jgi:hypothetical protein
MAARNTWLTSGVETALCVSDEFGERRAECTSQCVTYLDGGLSETALNQSNIGAVKTSLVSEALLRQSSIFSLTP